MQLFNISDKGELIEIDKLIFDDNNCYLVDDEEKNTIYIWVGLEVPQTKKDIIADIARGIDKERGGSTKILIMKQKREYGSFLAMMHDLERGLIPGKSIERRPEFVLKAPPLPKEPVEPEKMPKEKEKAVDNKILDWFQQIQNYRGYQPPKKAQKPAETVDFIKFKQAPIAVEEKKEDRYIEEIKEEPEEQEETDLKTRIREAAYYLSLDEYTYDELCWMLAEKIQKVNLEMPSIEDIRKKAEEVFNSSCTYDELCWLNAEMEILTRESFLEKAERKKFNY